MVDDSFGSLFGYQLENTVSFERNERLRKTWSNLNRPNRQSEEYQSLPIISSNQEGFTAGEPVIIPLVGGGRLEMGRSQAHYEYKGKPEVAEDSLVIRIRTNSIRADEQREGRMFEADVTMGGYGEPSILLLNQKGRYPDEAETKHLVEAKNWMALFKPEKDINWSALQSPSPQQQYILKTAGFHPSVLTQPTV